MERKRKGEEARWGGGRGSYIRVRSRLELSGGKEKFKGEKKKRKIHKSKSPKKPFPAAIRLDRNRPFLLHLLCASLALTTLGIGPIGNCSSPRQPVATFTIHTCTHKVQRTLLGPIKKVLSWHNQLVEAGIMPSMHVLPKYPEILPPWRSQPFWKTSHLNITCVLAVIRYQLENRIGSRLVWPVDRLAFPPLGRNPKPPPQQRDSF